MSENDEKKAPESLAPPTSAVPPSPTRPPPPSERRSTSMPPPPPRRSVKPSGPPPPPPRSPKGQRLAGVFSTPPPPTEAAPLVAPAAEPVPAPAVEAPVAVTPPPEPTPAPVVEPPAAFVPPPEPSRPVAPAPVAAQLPEPSAAEPPVAVPSIPAPAFDPAASVVPAYPADTEPSAALPPVAAFVPAPVVSSAPATSYSRAPSFAPAGGAAALGARLAAAQERFVRAIPPQWIELGRRQPILWMVVTPLVLATLLILIAVALAPDVVQTARPEPLTRAAAPGSEAPAPGAAPVPASPHVERPDSATVASLEAKSPEALSVEEVLLVKQYRAVQKRKDAQTLADKMLGEPAMLRDPGAQRELLRLAADPDTSELVLTSLARLVSPVAKDLLFEVSTGRAAPPATAELAASLLSSRDVRGSASPALLIALDLREAPHCEAVQAALARAKSEGDRRSLPSLGKLSSRRGCGADKSEDCYPCLRSQMKDVTATINAVKKRKGPSLGVD